MWNRDESSKPATIEWIQTPHHGPIVKPGLEGAACFGSHSCIARPQRQLVHDASDFEQQLEASKNVVRAWLAEQAG